MIDFQETRRELKRLTSEYNRLNAQYNLIMRSDLFNQQDRELIEPSLKKRINDAKTKLETACRDYELQGEIEIND